MPIESVRTLLRKGDVLLRYVVDSAGVLSAADAAHDSSGEDSSGEGSAGPASFISVEELEKGARSDEREVLDAWVRLGQVGELTEATLIDVRLVLDRTSPHPHGDTPAPELLDTVSPPEQPRATAANPRAFKGTKRQPPKAARAAAIDLRPFLHSRKGVERLLARLGELFGTEADHGTPAELWDAPAGLRLALGRSARDLDGHGRAREIAALWHQAGGDELPLLGAQLAVTAERHGSLQALEFLRCLASMLAGQRERTAAGLLKALGYGALEAGLAEQMAELSLVAASADDGHPIELVSWACYLAKVPLGQSGDVLVGARMAAAWGNGKRVSVWNPPNAEAARCLQFVAAEVEIYGVLDLWEALCEDPSGLPIFQRLRRALESGEVPRSLISSMWNYAACGHKYDSEKERLRALLKEMDRVLAAVGRTEERWQERAWFLVYHGTWDERPRVELAIARTPELIDRVCRDPFPSSSGPADVLGQLLVIDEAHWTQMMEASDEVFLALESAASRGNDEALIAIGLESALAVDEAWAVDRLMAQPRALSRLLRLLGVLSKERQREVLKRALGAWPPRLGVETPLRELVEQIDALGLPSGANPVKRRARLFLGGEAELSSAQVARQEELLREAWPSLAIPYLRRAVLDELTKAVVAGGNELTHEELEALPEDLIHALMLQSGLKENRRALRRVIRAVFCGDSEFLDRHPKNRAWLEKLSREVSVEAAAAWSSPPTLEVEIEGVGAVTLGVEHRPLEALRMGTYVGSCFGVGGTFRYAAAAVVMDANKQVVFARKRDGAFLARQIVCMSKGWKLLCSYVYPDPGQGPLLDAFVEYDRLLAAAAGVPLGNEEDEEDEDYEPIEQLVAEDDWFEGVLDPDDSAAASSSST